MPERTAGVTPGVKAKRPGLSSIWPVAAVGVLLLGFLVVFLVVAIGNM